MPLERYCAGCNGTHILEREVVQTCPIIAAPTLPAIRKAPILVVCFRGSDSARDLVDALVDEGIPARRVRNQEQLTAAVTKGKGILLSWGEKLAGVNLGTVPCLNRAVMKDKLHEIETLKTKNVAVPEFKLPQHMTINTTGWLGRSRHHQSANDLLGGVGHDFYTKKLSVAEEWRVHVFNGKSVRVGKKVPAPENGTPHAWIRSLSSGWKLDYGASLQGNPKRDLIRGYAKAAVAALGLNFGAVDVYVTTDGLVGVFEVNTAPSISLDNTQAAYVEAIREILAP